MVEDNRHTAGCNVHGDAVADHDCPRVINFIAVSVDERHSERPEWNSVG
jgi:hypothetical protein